MGEETKGRARACASNALYISQWVHRLLYQLYQENRLRFSSPFVLPRVNETVTNDENWAREKSVKVRLTHMK